MSNTQDNQDADLSFDDAMSSRTPGRDVLGKLDSSIPEVRVPHQARVDGEARAAELGLDLTAFIREIYYEAVYGAEHIARMYEERMLRASGKAGQTDRPATPSDTVGKLPPFLRKAAERV